MKLRYVACAFALIIYLPVFAQVFSQGDIERINNGIRARQAEAQRKASENARALEKQNQNQRNAERVFASSREAALAELAAAKNLPVTPVVQWRLDRLTCMYPPMVTLPPTSQELDSCLLQLVQMRMQVELDVAAELKRKAERERIEAANVAAEIAAREAKLAAEVAAREAKLAAEVAAREAALAEERALIASRVTVALGLAGVVALGIQRRKQGWAMLTAALTMGCLSGLLIYFMAAMLITGKTIPLSATFAAVTLFGGWALSTHLLLKGAVSASKVIARGFLLGAAEWLIMIPVGIIAAGSVVSDTLTSSGGSTASHAGAVIGGGVLMFLTGGFSVAMAIVCMMGFAVTYFITREMKPESMESTKKKCPVCAENIQAEAKKCRYCGSILDVQHGHSAG